MTAATIIQKLVRMRIVRNRFLKYMENRERSARMIQRNYKIWRMCTMIPRTWRAHKKRAALLVQKYLRGYLGFYKHKE